MIPAISFTNVKQLSISVARFSDPHISRSKESSPKLYGQAAPNHPERRAQHRDMNDGELPRALPPRCLAPTHPPIHPHPLKLGEASFFLVQPMASAVSFSAQSLVRAERAIRCSPFRLKLLQDLRAESVAIGAIADDAGIHQGYTRRPLAELTAENELLWLMAVGLLRREVDGQGLTDSFRLTPLGRHLLDRWDAEQVTDLQPRLRDHLYNSLSRWLRLPDWLQ
jgi:hypothetical protein